MSNMLEQAIVDAKTLREAAMKNAETAVVEKYSDEVREAVTKLLEQDGFDLDLEDPTQDPATSESPEETEEVVDQTPPAHLSEDETIVIDLNDIGKTLEQEKKSGEVSEDDGVPRSEVISSLETEEEVTDTEPGNRSDDDEIEINEEELAELFKEMLSSEDAETVEEVKTKDQLEIDEVQSEKLAEENKEEDPHEADPYSEHAELVRSDYTDGMDAKDIEYRERAQKAEELTEENNGLKKQIANLKEILGTAKTTLEEINLQNARLLYANRVLGDSSLNEQQKNKIAEMVNKARSVEEARLIFETLQKTMASTENKAPQSLSEAVSKSSSVILGGNRRDERTADENPTKIRWATLAGLKN
jgi:hypothetical protein